MIIDSLIVSGIAIVNLGTIQESDGIIERDFWLRNAGRNPITIVQGYTSCGCTTIDYKRDTIVEGGDSTCVTLRFNPANRGDEFYESGTIAYTTAESDKRRFVNMALEGTCVLKQETLLMQHPIVVSEDVRISRNRYDLGYLNTGQHKQLSVSVLCRTDGIWQHYATIDVSFTADDSLPRGLQHITRTFHINHADTIIPFDITYDVIINQRL